MLSRLTHDTESISLPKKWAEEVTELLHNTYALQCSEQSRSFEVYGHSYPKEVLLMVCLTHSNNTDLAPISYFASADLKENQDPRKLMDTLVDSVGLFFDEYFSVENWNDYISTWQEANVNKVDFFYKVTRENVGLTIKADELLKADGFEYE